MSEAKIELTEVIKDIIKLRLTVLHVLHGEVKTWRI